MKDTAPQSPFTATYFREYGIHSVDNGDSTDHLMSFPNWEETEIALKNDLPSSGTIITPEYITTNELSKETLERSVERINDRIEYARDISRLTDATLYLGTALKTQTRGTMVEPPKDIWHNTSLQIRHGKIEATHLKHHMLPIEEDIGMSAPERHYRRTVKNGRAVLVCADLYRYYFSPDSLTSAVTSDVIAPLMWASPLKDERRRPHERDDYYRSMLETTVGKYVATSLPHVRRVTTVDKGRPDIPPYNAVFTRHDS
ncbi:MAG: hypothetical protein WAS27_00075 [Candidatus Saccharimonadales bacterium]